MFISDFAIERPLVTVTTMLALVAFGVAALINLQTDEFPDVQQPVVGVTIPYPGASPAEVEREIVEPVEEAVFGISGLDAEKSTCCDRRPRAVHGLLRFREADPAGDAGHPRRDLREAGRPAAGDEGAGAHALRSVGPAGDDAHAHVGHDAGAKC